MKRTIIGLSLGALFFIVAACDMASMHFSGSWEVALNATRTLDIAGLAYTLYLIFDRLEQP